MESIADSLRAEELSDIVTDSMEVGNTAPKISIVMPVYKSALSITHAIDSVVAQGYHNIELIIIDGASNDGTDEIVRSYGDAITCYISEPDNGYADALNKGIALASGDYVMMLAADDVMIPGALASAVSTLSRDTDIWCGSVVFAEDGWFKLVPSSRDLAELEIRCSLRNPSSLFKRSVYERIGLWSTEYKCANDREFFLRCYKAGLVFQIEDVPLVIFASGGLSDTVAGISLAIMEDLEISIKYGLSREQAEAYADKQIRGSKQALKRSKLKKLLAKIGLLSLLYRVKGNGVMKLSRKQLAEYGCVGFIAPYQF